MNVLKNMLGKKKTKRRQDVDYDTKMKRQLDYLTMKNEESLYNKRLGRQLDYLKQQNNKNVMSDDEIYEFLAEQGLNTRVEIPRRFSRRNIGGR